MAQALSALAGLILSLISAPINISFQLPHPKLGHMPEGQIKGPQLLLSAPIRPQLRRGAHPGRLPCPLNPAFPSLGFQRRAYPKVVPPDAEGAWAPAAHPLPLFSEEENASGA